MKKSILIILSLLFINSFIFPQEKKCECLRASKNDIPSMGNTVTIFNEGKVRQVKGTVKWLSNEPMENAVIEVYKTSESELNKKSKYYTYSNDSEIIRDHNIYNNAQDKTRYKACRTNKDGKFCFKNLSKGLYILKIGLNEMKRTDMNEVYFIVEVDEKSGKNSEIEAFINVAG